MLDKFGSALRPNDLVKLAELKMALEQPVIEQIKKREARNNRLRAFNHRRSLIAKGIIKLGAE